MIEPVYDPLSGSNCGPWSGPEYALAGGIFVALTLLGEVAAFVWLCLG